MLLKFFVLLSLVLTISQADFLLKQKNRCVTDFWYQKVDSSYKVLYSYSSKPDTVYSSTSKSYIFLAGYDYNSTSKVCSLSNPAKKLGLTFYDYNFLIALIGVFTGFTFLFFTIYIFIEVAKK